MQTIQRYILLAVTFLATTLATAQQIAVPWQCGFEASDAVELGNWVLNPGTSSAGDQWCVGNATRSEGHQSLYISADGGLTALAGTNANVVMAYRPVVFPTLSAAKEYDISFDWKATGNGELYVFFGYESTLITGSSNILSYASATSAMTIPAAALNSRSYVSSTTLSRRQTMSGQSEWHNVAIDAGNGTTYSVRMTAANSNKRYALLFVWVNRGCTEENRKMGACVDNIQIASATYKKPSNLSASTNCADSSITLNWQNTASVSGFSVEYKNRNSGSWRRFSAPIQAGTAQSYTVGNITDGTYDFRVCGYDSQNEQTAYVVLNAVTMYCPENSCIYFTNLPQWRCTIGKYANPEETDSLVDYGYEDMYSRHTVVVGGGQYDERTAGGLSMTPKGEVASVRLGNWNTGSEGETITYDYVVDSTSAILLVKYAIVMQKPESSGASTFNLQIMDDQGYLIDPTCGVANFVFNEEDSLSWNRNKYGSAEIWWKDWQTLGMNLQDYIGQSVHIKFTTKDCSGGAHFEYAYFTLSCAEATIETDQCGSDPVANASAPEGFSYRWYAERDSTLFNMGYTMDPSDNHMIVVSYNSELAVNTGDTSIYVCRLSYTEESSCWFELKTKLSPRNPLAQYAHQWKPENCENALVLTDRSRIAVYNTDGTISVTKETCDYVDWAVTSLRTGKTQYSSLPSYRYQGAPTGDSVIVQLTAYMADGACENGLTDTIVLPSILTPDSIAEMTICDNQYVNFQGRRLTEPGRYDTTLTNQYGCDSTFHLTLNVNPTTRVSVVDTISSASLPYVLQGMYHGQSTRYERGEDKGHCATDNYVLKFSNTYDCDSTVNLKLTVVPQLNVAVDPVSSICADDGNTTLSYNITHGDYDSLTVTFDQAALALGFNDTTYVHDPYNNPIVLPATQDLLYQFPATITPGLYNVALTFYQHSSCGKPQRFELPLDVRYAASTIEQKWNDVLVVLAHDFNGGYTFSSYQWFKNGQPIEGATSSYLYGDLDFSADYTVQLTRQDGVTQFACPVRPQDRSALQISAFPTLLQGGSKIAARNTNIAEVRFFTTTGQLLYSQTIGIDGYLNVPVLTGCHLLQTTCNEQTTTQKVVITQ